MQRLDSSPQEEEYYDDPADPRRPYAGTMPVAGKESDFLKWLLNFKKEVTTPLRNLWRGYEEDDSGLWDKGRSSFRVMNERGITWAISFIESFINPVFITSNYAEKDINWTMKHIGRVVYNNLSTRYEEFGMNKLDIHRVATEIITKIHAILLGCLNNGYRKFFQSTHFTQELRQQTDVNTKGGGMFSKIKNSLMGAGSSGGG